MSEGGSPVLRVQRALAAPERRGVRSVLPLCCEAALGSPVLGSPVLGSPVLGSPVLGSPVLGSPVLGSPVLGSPVLGSPVLGSLARSCPAAGQPISPDKRCQPDTTSSCAHHSTVQS
ncbi:MAG: hypothetical protein NTV69_14325 [Caldilinea sp.]|nr:hypothetical protein [Caldilinea sp.]